MFGFQQIKTPGKFTAAIIVLLLNMGLITYAFIIEPAVKYLFAKDSKPTQKYNRITQLKTNGIKVIIIKSNIINAFATGIFPGAKLILLSSALVENLEPKEVDAIIYHEIGHIKLHHLVKLYAISIVCMIPGITIAVYFIPLVHNTWLTPLIGMLNGGFCMGLLPFLGTSFFMRKNEYEADAFAAKNVSVEVMTNTLFKLNKLLHKNPDKKSYSHPSSNQRIAHLKSN
ncbi:M48 family metalloprotease [Zhouia sp. PK063]|uniref:M48 family metalloprotease n=1 Tax=Zhouia sp. PK063 TaxID=3373602 RepID=UPI003787F7F7